MRPTRSTAPDGQALVEFALILPLILFIILGGIGLGLTIVNRMQLQHVAAEAVVIAAASDCEAALDRVPDLLGYQPDEAECSVEVDLFTVRLAHAYPRLMPFLPETISVRARSVAR